MRYVRQSEAYRKFAETEPRDRLRSEVVHHLNAGDVQLVTLLNESFGVLGRTAGCADSKETGVVTRLLPPVGEHPAVHVVVKVDVLHLVLQGRVVVVRAESVGTGQTGSRGRGSKRSQKGSSKRSSKRSFCEKTERKEIMRNIRLRLQYEGTRYQGWQKQTSTDNTIQGKMETLLTKMCGEPIEISASGRTDAGVHALGQVANFHTEATMSVEEILEYCNRYLPEDIAVVEVSEAAPRFHSRLNATGKRYRYRIINSQIPDVFWRRYATEEPEELDLDAMRKAAERLLGEHDFKAFTSAKKSKKSTVRRIDEIRIERIENRVEFVFTGNGFLHHMIRILMGTLLEVGKGIRTPESVTDVLESGDRAKAGALVPAKGLVLEEVLYLHLDFFLLKHLLYP